MTEHENTPRPHRDTTGGGGAGLEGWDPPDDHGQPQGMRQQHARSSLAAAVDEGRVAQADADTVLERLARGEDAHQIRRELRRAGVLPRAKRAGS